MSTRHPASILLPFVLVAITGCVVPVGPEWKDPQGNYPPTISTSSPPVPRIGSLLDFSVDGGTTFQSVQVVLADQNTRDRLYGRWIVDYPPFVPGQSYTADTFVLPGGDSIERSPVLFAPGCGDERLSRDRSRHVLLLVVSDRPFLNEDPTLEPLDAVANGNFRLDASWQFELDCQ